MKRTSNAIIGFWLLFQTVPLVDNEKCDDKEFYKYDLAEPNRQFFDAIKKACNILISTANIFILIEDITDEYLLNIIRHKLYEYKIPYSKLINTKDGLNSDNTRQMVINANTGQPEFVSIDLV